LYCWLFFAICVGSCFAIGTETCQQHLDRINCPGCPKNTGLTPKCDTLGNYQPMQCFPKDSSGNVMCQCWSKNGAMVKGSTLQKDLKSCDCLVAAASITPAKGAYIPKCDPDGSYSRLQTHGSTGLSWCVDENGNMLSEKKRGITCDGSENSKKETCAEHLARQIPCTGCQPKSGLIPTCNSDGEYEPMQCFPPDSFGNVYCQCMSKKGDIVKKPTLKKDLKTCDCLVTVHEINPMAIGAFKPKCDPTHGGYEAIQYHGSTGMSWCSSDTGVELTKRTRGPVRCT